MAEFCLKHYNELNGDNLSKKDVILSKDMSYCEDCGEFAHIVIGLRKEGLIRKLLNKFKR